MYTILLNAQIDDTQTTTLRRETLNKTQLVIAGVELSRIDDVIAQIYRLPLNSNGLIHN